MRKFTIFVLVVGLLGFSRLPGYTAGDKIAWLKEFKTYLIAQWNEIGQANQTRPVDHGASKPAATNKNPAIPQPSQPVAAKPAPTTAAQPASETSKKLVIHAGDPKTRELEQAIFREVNARRVAARCPPLVWDEKMAELARLRAIRAFEARVVSHDVPGYGLHSEMLQKVGIAAEKSGEVLMASSRLDWQKEAEFAAEGWFLSISHRTILTNPELKRMGIGVAWVDEATNVYVKEAEKNAMRSVIEYGILYTPK